MTSKMIKNTDAFFMQRALTLAARARGKTSPNPMVGAVLVKNGKIIAEGYHHKAGAEHAEVNALKKIDKKQIDGGTLYVNLEPCAHFGKQPPCANFLLNSGIKRLVVAMRDPNPLVNGEGIKMLRKAGIDVEVGVMENVAKRLNEVFVHSVNNHTPFVALKVASSLDGRIATNSGDSCWITNEKSRRFVHQLRSEADAIITSSQTVLVDDPQMNVRLVKGKNPLRVILDRKLKTPLGAKVYRDKNVLVVTTASAPASNLKQFQNAGISLLSFPGEDIPLKKLLMELYSRGITYVLLEAGSKLATSFLGEQLVQKIYFFMAPKLIGEGIPAVGDLGIHKVEDAIKLDDVTIRHFDNDIMVSGRVNYKK